MPSPALPTCLNEITAAWLTEMLRAAGALPTGRVVHFLATRLGQRGTKSDTHRLALGYDHDPGPSTPRTLIVKLASLDPATRAARHASGAYERELRFYTELAGKTELRTPRCYFAGREPETSAFVLVVGEALGEPGIPTLHALEQTLCEIAKLHARFWDAPELGRIDWLEHSPAAEAAIDQQLRSVAARIVARTGLALPPAFREALALAGAHLAQLRLLERLRPRTIVHGDLHPGRLVTGADGSAVFGWQSVTIGSPGRDVARLIAMSLPPMPRQRHEYHMLGVYQAALERCGVRDYSLCDCYEDYQRGLVASALLNASAIAELGENELLAPRVPGEPSFVRVLIDYIDSALTATGALQLLHSEIRTPAVAA